MILLRDAHAFSLAPASRRLFCADLNDEVLNGTGADAHSTYGLLGA